MQTPTTRELTIPAYAAAGLVTELEWLETKQPVAGEVMERLEEQLPEGYWDADADDAAVYTVRLSDDHAAIVRTVLARIGEEFTIEIGVGVLDAGPES